MKTYNRLVHVLEELVEGINGINIVWSNLFSSSLKTFIILKIETFAQHEFLHSEVSKNRPEGLFHQSRPKVRYVLLVYCTPASVLYKLVPISLSTAMPRQFSKYFLLSQSIRKEIISFKCFIVSGGGGGVKCPH